MLFKKPTNILLIALFALVIFLDQTWKLKTRHDGGFFVCNTGISFGLNIPNVIFWLILAIILLIITLFTFKNKILLNNFTLQLGLYLFFAGAFSNLIDRLLFNCVIDNILLINDCFPVFNLADISIFIGSGLLIYYFHKLNTQKVNK